MRAFLVSWYAERTVMPPRAPRTVYTRDRAAWRAWLGKHHAAATEAWLLCYKKHTGKPCVAYEDAVNEALCFGWIDGTVKRIDADRYMQRFTPRRRGSQWSATNVRRYWKLLRAGLVTKAGKRAFAARRRAVL